MVVIKIRPGKDSMGVLLQKMHIWQRLIGQKGKAPDHGFEHQDQIGKFERLYGEQIEHVEHD